MSTNARSDALPLVSINEVAGDRASYDPHMMAGENGRRLVIQLERHPHFIVALMIVVNLDPVRIRRCRDSLQLSGNRGR